MELNRQTVAIFVSDEGRLALRLAGLELGDLPALTAQVKDTDDMGIWVRVEREDGEHILLVRWDYVVCLDLPMPGTKAVGLRP